MRLGQLGRLIQRCWYPLLAMAGLWLAALWLVTGLLLLSGALPGSWEPQIAATQTTPGLWALTVLALGGSLLLWPLVVQLVARACSPQPQHPSLLELLRSSLRWLSAVALCLLCWAGLSIAGALALVIGTYVLLVGGCLAVPLTVLEGERPWRAPWRSLQLLWSSGGVAISAALLGPVLVAAAGLVADNLLSSDWGPLPGLCLVLPLATLALQSYSALLLVWLRLPQGALGD